MVSRPAFQLERIQLVLSGPGSQTFEGSPILLTSRSAGWNSRSSAMLNDRIPAGGAAGQQSWKSGSPIC